jgi:uncharacterized protein (TIGR00730 family)
VLEPEYYDVATELGKRMSERGDVLVFGGGSVGLMGAAARSLHKHGGKVIGVIPQMLVEREVAYRESDELIISKGMADRKEIEIDLSDAFIILAGGYGTLDELLEVITLRQLGYHEKPIVIVNTNGFFNPLLEQFERFEKERFTRVKGHLIFRVVDTVEEALEAIDGSISEI